MRSLPWLSLLACAACGGSTPTTDDGGSGGCAGGMMKFDNTVCLALPTTPAARTPCGNGVNDYCDKTATAKPNLSCLSGGPKMHPQAPATVTLTGFVHPFSSGSSNAPVKIEIYKASDAMTMAAPDSSKAVATATVTFDPSKATDATQFRACDTDPKIGCVPVAADLCKNLVPVCNDGLLGRSDDKEYCNAMGVCSDLNHRLRWEPRFAIPNVPTNTSLVIRALGADASTWATLVSWNVFLASDDKSCGGDLQATDCLDTSDMANPKYQLNVNVLSQSDYGNIPHVAGLSMGIAPGEGAVAGEVHDCDNVRVANVQVGSTPQGDRLTYFNGDPYNTLPDSGRAAVGTDRLGLYSSLDVLPGKVVVDAAGLVDGSVVSVGKFTASVWADSVAVVNLNCGKPPQ